MQIPQEKLQEFKELYKEKFGAELTNAEALDKATKLLTFVRAVYKPIPKKNDA